MSQHEGLLVAVDDRGVATLTLHRPEVRNAFDAALVAGLTEVAAKIGSDRRVRVVVLTGSGTDAFTAGADLRWMQTSARYSREDNLADATRMDALFRTIWDLPQLVVGRINGHTLGGGMGLAAVCDAAISRTGAVFGFSEVRLGLVPAVTSPYVVRKIGLSHARALFATGARIDADEARRIGLVHRVVERSELDAAVNELVAAGLASAPGAVAVSKRLPELGLRDLDEATSATPALIADARAGSEGREGMAAFLEGRPPSWAPSPNRSAQADRR